MNGEATERMSWAEVISRSVPGAGAPAGGRRLRFMDRRERTLLVARARWLLLILFTLYAATAASIYSLSSYGFFLSPAHVGVLLIVVALTLGYNAACSLYTERIARVRASEHVQVLLDLLLVTVLVHFSGGGASWFWPVYLVVTIEAAVLLDRREDVWLMGGLGGICLGAVLAAGYFDLIPSVGMPFVAAELHHDGLYLFLFWLWAGLLNLTVAFIAAFLMAVIRGENRALRHSEQRLLDFLESANDLIFSFAPDGRLLYANRSCLEALDYTAEEIGRLSMRSILHRECVSDCLVEFQKALGGERSNPIEGRFVARDGRFIEVEGNISCSFQDHRPTAVWGICRDITERKDAQNRLEHLANHDMLTGLPNRSYFLDRLKQARSLARRNGHQVGVLFLDLDRFKIINDTLGHAVGDRLLKETASRLLQCVRETDTVARQGGDEFTIILGQIHAGEDAETVARKVIQALAQPLTIDGHELYVTTSIGIALFPADAEEPEALVKKADIAMYQAKNRGRNTFQSYTPAMDRDADRRLDMENALRKALARDELRLHYQPKVDIRNGAITALEALLRWEHPEHGLLPPGDFISMAEETGLIVPIGEWVLRQACAENARWRREGLPPVRVAVNLSGYQLQQRSLPETVRTILAETGLPPSGLELEVTETVIMQNPDFAARLLDELRLLGVHLSIDDFGTGYSSLAHLKRFAVNTLKIDKSFVRDVVENSTDAAIASAIIAMGNSLNLTVIAEGVETESQFRFLRERMCHEIQGYLFSRPVPPDEVGKLLGDAPQAWMTA